MSFFFIFLWGGGGGGEDGRYFKKLVKSYRV